MLSHQVYFRSLIRDRIFVVLASLSLLSFTIASVLRRPAFETTPLPFELGLFFFIVNLFFALLSIRREPLLAYMFLTLAIITNATLVFFFRYLLIIQG